MLLERGVHRFLGDVEGAADRADQLIERVLKVRLEELVRARARARVRGRVRVLEPTLTLTLT